MAKEVITRGFGSFVTIARTVLAGFFSKEVVEVDEIFTSGAWTPSKTTGGAWTTSKTTDGAWTPTVTTAGMK